jgi:hypothetical protein
MCEHITITNVQMFTFHKSIREQLSTLIHASYTHVCAFPS